MSLITWHHHQSIKMTDFADWTPVVLKGKAAPKPAGSAVQAVRVSNEAARLRKIESSEDAPKAKILDPASRHELILRRVANKWDQAELNRQCNFPANTIREIEAGRQTPTGAQLNVLNRVLKCSFKLS